MNYVWLFMISVGFLTAALSGRIDSVTNAAVSAAKSGVELSLGLVGVMALWMGVMRIAEDSGLVGIVARLFRPLLRLVFPGIPRGHAAEGAIVGNFTANLLGLGNAATPLGLKAMQEMQRLNPDPETATDAMCTFLALNTACLTLVPATVIAVRAASGARTPTDIIGTTIITTLVTTVSALSLDRILRRTKKVRKKSVRGRGHARGFIAITLSPLGLLRRR